MSSKEHTAAHTLISSSQKSTKIVKSGVRSKPPAAGKGRKKGSKNKLTRSAKEAFEMAFQGLGGAEALTEWARTNQTEFYKLYARLIPRLTELSGPDGRAMRVQQAPTFPKCETVEEWMRLVDNQWKQKGVGPSD